MKKLILVANPDRAGTVEAMDQLAQWLKTRAEVIDRITDMNADLSAVEADAVVSFGGDGTILNVASCLGDNQLPVFGVNMGRLGFLAEISIETMFSGMAAFLQDRVYISPRIMLQAELCCGGQGGQLQYGLNDVVVFSNSPGRIGEWEVMVDELPLTTFRGDGLIVATPTGSTAYSLSSGGPILTPELRAMVLTPVCPHELANRPLVISADEKVCIKGKAGAPLRYAVDGRTGHCGLEVFSITIQVSRRLFRLVQLPEDGRYEILRRKLGWYGRIDGIFS